MKNEMLPNCVFFQGIPDDVKISNRLRDLKDFYGNNLNFAFQAYVDGNLEDVPNIMKRHLDNLALSYPDSNVKELIEVICLTELSNLSKQLF